DRAATAPAVPAFIADSNRAETVGVPSSGTAHTFTSPSPPTVASFDPSGLNAAAATPATWAGTDPVGFGPAVTSRTVSVPSAVPTATRLPSGRTATAQAVDFPSQLQTG